MDLSTGVETPLSDLLFHLPNRPMKRTERVRRIEQAIASGQVEEVDLDLVMARLLEELQRTT